uniref:NADH-ubiquinone oxidoreductase chain 6 n=1 Tax=Coelophthinia sp. 1 JPL-2022a TaxID=3002427 RepID=A0A9E8S9T2_9DIPT|nr:NADH dehydrogenase subunit 6 [Coelophthinia sp. 1 JPL-2022a]
MIQFMIYSYILILSILFTQMKHPLTMGMMLLIQTFLISLMIGLIHKTFWFSYILFLVFLGGMLVMFIYVTSLSSNEMFSLSNKLIFLLIFISSMIFMLMLIVDKFYSMNLMNFEMMPFNNLNIYMNENIINLTKLYNYPSNYITLFLIIYLLLTLVISVKITNFFYGPLRPSF